MDNGFCKPEACSYAEAALGISAESGELMGLAECDYGVPCNPGMCSGDGGVFEGIDCEPFFMDADVDTDVRLLLETYRRPPA